MEVLAALAEPTRRRLYELVVASSEPVGRDAAVTTLGISRELAAFHLDRLVAGGLLETEYRRLSGRTGPGAGRPAKLYRRAEREVEISLPPRRYGVAADLMATALARLVGTSGIEALVGVARERGTATGIEARRQAGRRGDSGRPLALVVDALRGAGFEPQVALDGRISLGNCPYRALAAEHPDLTCGMNLAWAEGVVTGLGIPDLAVELAPEPSLCCIALRTSFRPADDTWMAEPGEAT